MLACLHNDKVDEANIFDNSIAKVPAECLSNLDAISETKVWELTWLHCRQHKLSLGSTHQAQGTDVEETA